MMSFVRIERFPKTRRAKAVKAVADLVAIVLSVIVVFGFAFAVVGFFSILQHGLTLP